MSDATESRPVHMSATGLPTTVLPPADADARRRLADALAAPEEQRRNLIAEVVAAHPRDLDAWARLGDHARDRVEAYAAYRVGYHRGLDALRASGWRGSGFVRWRDETNRGFLRALRGLGRVAGEIGERDESERIALFLAQLDPSGIPAEG